MSWLGRHRITARPQPDLQSQALERDGTWAGIAAPIRVGVPQPRNYRSPMPAMGSAQLSADQVNAVAAYVWALSNANAPPQGTSCDQSPETSESYRPKEYPIDTIRAWGAKLMREVRITPSVFAVKSVLT